MAFLPVRTRSLDRSESSGPLSVSRTTIFRASPPATLMVSSRDVNGTTLSPYW
ncbi:hypothetical protein SHIRM173S_01230 [Streptomyces hirsutus]